MIRKQLPALWSLAIVLAGCDGGTSSPTFPTATSLPPVTFVVSGVVSEMTATVTVPIVAAVVETELHRRGPNAVTEPDGRYTLRGLSATTRNISVSKWGYVTENRTVTLSDNMQLDIQLVRAPMYVLSGVAFEITPAGRVPIEGLEIYCDSCGSPDGHTFVQTDKNGFYSLAWAMNGVHPLFVSHAGYEIRDPAGELRDEHGRIVATVDGDTRFDIELVRR